MIRALALLACAGCSQVFGLDSPVPRSDAAVSVDMLIVLDDAAIDAAPPPEPRVRLVDIDNTKVSGTGHNEFPLLVAVMDEPWLRSSTYGGTVARDDGFDIYFSSDQAGTARLAHEVEGYDPQTGSLTAWVKINLVPASTLYLHYGDPAITTSQAMPAAVWTSTYELVMHMSSTAEATGQHANATSTDVTTVPGMINGAYGFNGTTSVMNAASAASIDNIFDSGGMFEAWIYLTSYGENGFGRVASKGGLEGWSVHVDNTNNPGTLSLIHGRGSQTYQQFRTQANALTIGAWHHVAVIYNKDQPAQKPTFFVDGVASAADEMSDGAGGPDNDDAFDLLIGNVTAGDRAFDGLIDELRLHSGSRSADWVSSQYRNQSNPAAFYTIGPPL